MTENSQFQSKVYINGHMTGLSWAVFSFIDIEASSVSDMVPFICCSDWKCWLCKSSFPKLTDALVSLALSLQNDTHCLG